MTMTTLTKPPRLTGRARPDPYNLDALARAEAAQTVVEDLWIETERQRAVLNAIRSYMRSCARERLKGKAITGRRLSQHSQAGKSSIAEQLIRELQQEARAAGKEPNPLRVVHINIDQRMTLKMLLQEILNRLGDDFVDEPGSRGVRLAPAVRDVTRPKTSDTMKVLEQRIETWVRKLGVELIIVDEIQRLVTKPETDVDPDDPGSFLTADATDVTKKLQAFLDRGVVPLFFIGDEHSPKFFALNRHFAARLLAPLELAPLDISKSADRKRFHEFCVEYDRQIVDRELTTVGTCLTHPAVLTGLIKASSGHIGRAARIIQVALPAALARGAVTMEPYDLSNAVRDYAMPMGWVEFDPFSVMRPDPKVGTGSETVDAG